MSFSGHAAAASRNFPPVHAMIGGLAEASAARPAANEPTELEAIGTICKFGRNETVFDEGGNLDAAYKILSGVVRLYRLTADGRRQIAGFRLPGDLIGLEWDNRYAMTAEAVREVVAVRYASARLTRLSHEKPAVRDHLMSRLREDLRAAQDHLITLGCQSANERVASFLLQLARHAGAKDGTVIDIQLGRQDIADYLGITVETVCRTFSDFKRRGIVSLPKRREVCIRSLARLHAQTANVN